MVGVGRGTGADGTVGPYRLIREIGHGGMGAVFYAVDEQAQPPREVAIKMLRDALDPEHARRFLHEQRVLAGLNHPGIPAGRTWRWSSSPASRSTSTAIATS